MRSDAATREVRAIMMGGLLSDLRKRLARQAQIPPLGEEFHVESCVLPARGQLLSGDVVVASRRGSTLEVALADVSGHGSEAGMRASLLSGALAGLLGEVSAKGLLPAANRYLVRQGWRDGFASCIHLVLDLADGSFDVGTAGHPSAVHFRAAQSRWETVGEASGLLLGLFDRAGEDSPRARGRLQPGDLLLLYTDGVVEGASGETGAGTVRMLRQAAQAAHSGVEGLAHRICAASATVGGVDDRSVVVVWRRPL